LGGEELREKADTDAASLPIIFFGDRWDRRKRRRQQFAVRLAAGPYVRGVLYVESPLPLTSLVKARLGLAGQDAAERWSRVRRLGSRFRPDDSGVLVCTPRTLFRLTGIGWIDRLQRRRVARQVIEGSQELWSANPRNPDALAIITHPWWPASFYRSLGLDINCYDCTDDFSTFYDVPKPVRAMLRAHDEELTRSAHVVTCVSESLLEDKRMLNPNSHLLPNGVDLDLFTNPSPPMNLRQTCDIPSDVRLLGYVGGVNQRVDTRLFRALVVSRPEWHIAIAGTNKDFSVCGVPHIHLLGQLPLEQIPAFLSEVDVCLIPHKVDDLTRSMDPQKIYDYLASGKPIVSTPVAGTERFRELIEIGRTPDEFVAAVARALGDGERSRWACLAAAAANGWQTRVERLCELVAESRCARRAA
jgi:glycosyltransferase involved in cell wall biosynthesis